MIPAINIAVPLLISAANFPNGRGFRQTTAASITYEGHQALPTEATELDKLETHPHADALDWMSLAREVLPNAKPLTSEERSSINEFFWSHFK